MTLDYGNGDVCQDANYNRKGQIIDDFEYIVNYKKEIFQYKETITLRGFKKDSVLIDGEFLITSSTGNSITVEATKTKVTYANNKSAYWEGTLNFIMTRENGETKSNTITGTINGITKRNEIFSASTTTPVIFSYDCSDLQMPKPVSGTMILTVNNTKSEVNYGDGTCDNQFTLRVNGKDHKLEL
jgi:hypothetical protein